VQEVQSGGESVGSSTGFRCEFQASESKPSSNVNEKTAEALHCFAAVSNSSRRPCVDHMLLQQAFREVCVRHGVAE
jgi:hypothetical protein